MRKLTTEQMREVAWGLSAAVVLIGVVAWGNSYAWQLSRLSVYQIFPLLGLTAFSLMWAHYIASALRQYFGLEPKALKDYFEITSAIVLTTILLHPGLLAWQLWLDGEGLPPGSELNYVMPSARWAILFGFTSLAVFLSYEFRRWFATKSWWKFAQYASDIAMVLIFFHALKLGGALQSDWFRAVWYLYGLTFAGALVYTYGMRYRAYKIIQSGKS
ncbi:MAG TPA: DUF2127 domain-containing protein [Candidatus Limnocylindria bacterium]|nr:DUF2127 domain-containing protein [Candidatus Limnocylindria bacterium]